MGKKIIGVVSLLVIAVFGLGVGIQTGPEPERHAPASLMDHYRSLKDMKSKSVVVIEVQGTSEPSYLTYGGAKFSTSQVRVVKTIKSPSKLDGKGLRILETVQFKGAALGPTPLIKNGDHYLLFLEPYQGPITTDAYVIKGVWQGKLKVKTGNGELEYIGPNGETQELQKDVRGKTISDVEKM